jgi:uncharacterized protein
MSDKYVEDPREVVKPGDIVRVKVLDVDLQRKRISLTLRLDDEPGRDQRAGRGGEPRDRDQRRPSRGGGQAAQPGQGGRGGGRGGQGGGRNQGGRGQGGGRNQGQRQGQGQGQGGGRGRSGQGGFSGGGAMADALRRAGLDKGLPGGDRKPR